MSYLYRSRSVNAIEPVHAVRLRENFYLFGKQENRVDKGSWLVVHQNSGYQNVFSHEQFQELYESMPPQRVLVIDAPKADALAAVIEKALAGLSAPTPVVEAAPEPEKPAFKFKPKDGVLVVRMRSPQDVDPALKGLGTEYMLGEVVSCPHRYRLGESGPDYEYPAGTLVAFTGNIVQVLGYTQHPQYLKGNTDARYAVGFAQVIGVFEPRTPAQAA